MSVLGYDKFRIVLPIFVNDFENNLNPGATTHKTMQPQNHEPPLRVFPTLPFHVLAACVDETWNTQTLRAVDKTSRTDWLLRASDSN